MFTDGRKKGRSGTWDTHNLKIMPLHTYLALDYEIVSWGVYDYHTNRSCVLIDTHALKKERNSI